VTAINLLHKTGFASALTAHPVVAVDIGARGGFEPDLLPLAFAVDAIGFEPEPEAFGALKQGGPWRSLRHLPVAIGGTNGPRTLHVTRDNASTTLLEPDPDSIAEFDKPQFVTVTRTLTVSTRTLDDALAEAGVARVDYLKLDIEGAELEVLRAAPRTVDGLLALKVEVSFLPLRRGQALAADIDQYFAERGFKLMDFIRPAHWRRDGYIIHPQIGEGVIPYSRGQLIHGDYVFFRKPGAIREPERALRAAALAMTHGYFDYAAGLLRRPDVAAWLMSEFAIDAERTLRSVSMRFGWRAWRTALWQHVRLLSPFMRSLVRLLRHGRS
jgi:FkbM family methyltransferase